MEVRLRHERAKQQQNMNDERTRRARAESSDAASQAILLKYKTLTSDLQSEVRVLVAEVQGLQLELQAEVNRREGLQREHHECRLHISQLDEDLISARTAEEDAVDRLQGLQARFDEQTEVAPSSPEYPQECTEEHDARMARLEQQVRLEEIAVQAYRDLVTSHGRLRQECARYREAFLASRGTFRTYVRIRRPPAANHDDDNAHFFTVNKQEEDGRQQLVIRPSCRTSSQFIVDRVFLPKDEDHMVYSEVAPLLESARDSAITLVVICCGRSGTGKSKTVKGLLRNLGPAMFQDETGTPIASSHPTRQPRISCSELYSSHRRAVGRRLPRSRPLPSWNRFSTRRKRGVERSKRSSTRCVLAVMPSSRSRFRCLVRK
jgi:hypothetical protein